MRTNTNYFNEKEFIAPTGRKETQDEMVADFLKIVGVDYWNDVSDSEADELQSKFTLQRK